MGRAYLMSNAGNDQQKHHSPQIVVALVSAVLIAVHLGSWTRLSQTRALTGRIPMQDEVSYICDACGEEIVIPLDPTAGHRQEYVEDCPVCCRPNIIRVEIDDDGEARISSHAE